MVPATRTGTAGKGPPTRAVPVEESRALPARSNRSSTIRRSSRRIRHSHSSQPTAANEATSTKNHCSPVTGRPCGQRHRRGGGAPPVPHRRAPHAGQHSGPRRGVSRSERSGGRCGNRSRGNASQVAVPVGEMFEQHDHRGERQQRTSEDQDQHGQHFEDRRPAHVGSIRSQANVSAKLRQSRAVDRRAQSRASSSSDSRSSAIARSAWGDMRSRGVTTSPRWRAWRPAGRSPRRRTAWRLWGLRASPRG